MTAYSTSEPPARLDSEETQRDAELAALRYENTKLQKINRTLIKRIENGLSNYSGAYGSFENAVILAQKVKARTVQLQQALGELEKTNRELEQTNHELSIAKREAEHKHGLLIDAIESISDAFVLFDEHRHFTLANSAFYALWSNSGLSFKEQLTLEEIQDQIASAGIIDTSISTRDKITRRGELSNQGVFRLKEGRWVQITERPTREGGLVIIFTDITSLKESETARREKALSEKSEILQSTLDHLSQGVALFGENHQLEAWNNQFLRLTNTPSQLVSRGVRFQTLAPYVELGGGTINLQPGDLRAFQSEKILKGDRLLEIQRHGTSSGGFVITYTDITEREEYEAALRASEHRIRTITDAMPALIGYISSDMRYAFINRTFEEWFQKPRNNISDLSLVDILGQEEFERHHPWFNKTLGGEHVSFEIEQQLPCGRKYIHKTYIPDYDAQGNTVGLFALEQDVTQQRRTAEALNHAYQHMEHRVTERTKELTALNHKLRREVGERKEAEQRLVEAKGEAEHANLTKTKFLAAVSHDLLQPMSAARLFTTALQELKLPAKAVSLVNSINYSMEDVESLVSSLVDISKLDAGVVKPDIAPVCVDNLLLNLANEFSSQAGAQSLRFRFTTSTAVISTDCQLLARILRNLLSNAIRYTDNGDILLGCRRRQEGLQIEVWDTGVGIPQEKLTEIFLEFKQLPSDKSRGAKGLGLGLSIVDKISRVLGNQISVRSSVGKGSVFSILVPYGQLDEPEIIHSPPPLVQLQNPVEGKRLLVIDNDTSICAGMETLLSSWNCQVQTETSIHHLDSDQLKDNPPDLVIVDYHLDNGETGIEAAVLLKQWLGETLPILMITANRTQDLKKQVRELELQLLNKPIKPHKLKSMLRFMLG